MSAEGCDAVPETENQAKQSWLARIAALPNDSPQKTLIVALVLCVACSVAVASASVFLRPLQEQNRVAAMRAEVLKVAGLYTDDKEVDALFEQVDTRIVDLQTGEYTEDIDVASYDQRAAARNPQQNVVIPADQDIAGIFTRAKYAPVYIVQENDKPETIILPVHGYGLWSTMYAFVALGPDGRTIKAVSFYEHAETPGLGAEVENPKWQESWKGKLALADDGSVQFQVNKGSVDPGSAEAAYSVDGLSGATLTSDGVTNLMQYWLGENGFGPYLARFRAEQ